MVIRNILRLCLLATVVASTAFACESTPPVTEVSREEREMIIVKVNRPKYYYLDLRDSDGNLFPRVYIAKRCSEHRDYPVGTKVKADVVKMSDGTTRVDGRGLRKLICRF